METINSSFTRQVLPIDQESFGDGYVEIVTVSAPLMASRYSDAKAALEEIQYRVNDDIFIHRPCSEYDCTGRPFTMFLELLNRFSAGNNIHAVYKHTVRIDC